MKKPQTIKKRILFLSSNPKDATRLQVTQEFTCLEERLLQGKYREYYKLLMPKLAVTRIALIKAMHQKPYIIHFSGHGTVEGLYIEDDESNSVLLSQQDLREILNPISDGLAVVVLNSCYSSSQAEAISKLGCCVIGHNLEVSDKNALKFTEGFYIGLGEGASIARAVMDAVNNCKDLQVEEIKIKVWKNGTDYTNKLNELDQEELPIIAEEVSTNFIPEVESFFVGRTKELEDLDKIFKEGHNFISVVGTGGIGKTQLLSKYIEQAKLPKGQLVWIQCDSSTSLDTIIEKAGYSIIFQGEDKSEKTKIEKLTYFLKRDQRYLFLEDFHEIEDKKGVKLFLKRGQKVLEYSKVIVISRDKIRSLSLKPKELLIKGFKDRSILLEYIQKLQAFFESSVQFDVGKFLSICMDRLKGHPFIIYLAFYLLDEGESIETIEASILEVGEEETDTYNVQTVSERLLNDIFNRKDATKEERQFIREFSVFRGIVRGELLQEVLGNPSKTMKKLQKKNILRRYVLEEQEVYDVHPIIRDFCYKKLKDINNERKVELHQLIANVLSGKRKQILSIINEEEIYYHLVQIEQWSLIMQDIKTLGIKFFAQGYINHLEHMILKIKSYIDIGLDKTLLISWLGRIGSFKGNFDNALKLYNESLIVNRELKDDHAIASDLSNIGMIHLKRGDYEKAMELFKKSLNLNQKAGELSSVASNFNNIGGIYQQKSDHKKAIEFFKKSLSIREKLGDQSEIMISLNNIGRNYASYGDFNEALQWYQRGLKISKQEKEPLMEALFLNNIAEFYKSKGRWENTLGLYKESLSIREELGDISSIATSLNNIGYVYFMMKPERKLDKAIEYYENSLKIRERLGEKSGIATNLNNIGRVYQYQKKYKKAIECYERSIGISTQLGEKAKIAGSSFNIGTIYEEQGNLQDALRLYRKSLEIYKTTNQYLNLATILIHIAEVYMHLGKYKKVTKYLLKSLGYTLELDKDYTRLISQLALIKPKFTIFNYKKLVKDTVKGLNPKLQKLFTPQIMQEILGK